VNYLLDTNACIALINGKPASVRTKFQTATDKGAKIFVSSIAAFELWYGVAKSSRREFNRKRLEAFFAGPLYLLPFANEDGEIAGAIRADLEANGKPIGAYDLLIAGQAMRNKLTLVTANLLEFARIKALIWTDWAKTDV
jgi:tRNA(fMet)-specific endonuclease VapC